MARVASHPVQIRTQRLVLRPPALADAARVSLLAGDYDVACMTGTIPHPYSEQMAGEWLTGARAGEEGVVFMIERDGTLIGCTGYRAFDADHAELGFWVGKPYWGNGYATEAVRALIAHAFDADGFAYLKAGHFADNPRSERILRKLGFLALGGELRECAARGTTTDCLTYRLDRADALANLRWP
jgi:RimJ/RimL family protein N-acetyltransferase